MPNRSRSGGLSVSLAVLDGHVVVGCVAGPLGAASPANVSNWKWNNRSMKS